MTATAVVVDPRRLPVPLRKPASRALVTASHIWILHKRVLLRLLAASIVVVFVTAVYEMRDMIGAGVMTVAGMAQGEFVDAGFGIDKIEITGQTLTGEAEIFKALALDPRASTVSFDAEAARARIAELPAVETVTIKKVYPGDLIVSITEKVPVARWRVDGVTFVVDAAGEQIGEAGGAYSELPLVIGDGAADDALVMIRALDRFESLKQGLVALSRIGDRRWDMIFQNGLRVQLPEQGVAQALTQLTELQAAYRLLDRDVTLIDLRVPDMLALRPSADALAAMAPKGKAKPKPAINTPAANTPAANTPVAAVPADAAAQASPPPVAAVSPVPATRTVPGAVRP